MENLTGTEQVLKFRKALNEIFSSPNGETVMKFLQESYVDVPALDEKPEMTYYRLGQKEFVQGLLKDATTDIKELEKLTRG